MKKPTLFQNEMETAPDVSTTRSAATIAAKRPTITPGRVLGGLGILAFVALAILLFPQAKATLAKLIEWTQGVGSLGPIYLAVIYAVACVLFLPGSLLTLGAGFAFGLGWGTFAASLGSLMGVSASFLLGRTALRSWVERLTSRKASFKAIDEAVGREGFKIVLLTRLSPVFPFNLLNYGFGVTRVKFLDFFLGSWIGMFPGTVLYVYLGTAAKNVADLAMGHGADNKARVALLGVGLAATVVVTVVIARIAKRALRSAINPSKTLENTHA